MLTRPRPDANSPPYNSPQNHLHAPTRHRHRTSPQVRPHIDPNPPPPEKSPYIAPPRSTPCPNPETNPKP